MNMHAHALAAAEAVCPDGWDHVASAAGRLPLGPAAERLGPGACASGDALWVRVLRSNPAYDLLELASGDMIRLRAGESFVGIAGSRQALRGYAGAPPARVAPGDRLDLLSMGGILGLCTGGLLDLGAPTSVEVIDRLGTEERPFRLRDYAVPPRASLRRGCPILAVVGTSMAAGKTRAAVELIAGAVRAGLRVAAVKLTGVACLRDVLRMKERGALATLSFLDAGLPSTVDEPALTPFAKGLIAELDKERPDLIVAELGDGILGAYGVDQLLADRALRSRTRAVVLSASDHVGAWGGVELLRRYHLKVHLVTGPLTDSPEACRFIEMRLGIPALNACRDGERLFSAVRSAVGR